MRRISAMLIAICVTASPAAAQEWNGAVVGMSLGHDWTGSGSTFGSILALPIGPLPVEPFKDESLSIGGIAGYRADLDGFVLGGEADAALTVADGKSSATPFYDIKPRWQGSVRAVAGVPTGNALIFATAGIAVGGFTFDHEPGVPWTLQSHDETPLGWLAGGGIELATGRFHPRIEYRHVGYRRTSANVSTIIYRERLNADSIRLSVLVPF